MALVGSKKIFVIKTHLSIILHCENFKGWSKTTQHVLRRIFEGLFISYFKHVYINILKKLAVKY